MLSSGNLTPSTATLVQARPKYLIEENIDETRISFGVKSRDDARGRSAALERAYVHDVYEYCEECVDPIRPRATQFLAGLDAGSLVCDVGCGNGRYLTACNPLIYTIGVDRCYRLTKVARSKGGEVTLCDNLELPFRDDSFDAVLSLAVIHHFATTERRVSAIRELARVLKIGGRVIISVWAFEQRHRRFESQDVLIPWQHPKNRNSYTSDEEDDDDYLPPYHAYTEESTNSSRSAGDGDSSSLSSSSPGDSCYSFVRRAIQKLASGKRHPWFTESWNSKDTKNGDSLDFEDAKDLPIELRRLEDFEDMPDSPLSAGIKSRSLGSILNPPPRKIVRSRSSVPSLGAQILETNGPTKPTIATIETASSRRPKLVKQKQSFCDEELLFLDKPFYNGLPDEAKHYLRKQSSLNEELMAENRLREKERVRKRIQKQMSLNEAFLCRSQFTRRLQVLREGFATKFKTSTDSLERVTKSRLCKIIQNFKGAQYANQTQSDGVNSAMSSMAKCRVNSTGSGNTIITNCCDLQKSRRHSRESGSDSSKESSLQSDTSVESEDSFASVIYIPRPDQMSSEFSKRVVNTTISNTTTTTSTSTNVTLTFTSEQSKPLTYKLPSVPTSPYSNCNNSCPTPVHSPDVVETTTTTANAVAATTTTTTTSQSKLIQQSSNQLKESTHFIFDKIQEPNKSDDNKIQSIYPKKKASREFMMSSIVSDSKPLTVATKPLTLAPIPAGKTSQTKITRQVVKNLPPIPKFKKTPSFPIVRRLSSTPVVPRLPSLEIFNPETDDLDSDSSDPSSPDSVDSVVSAWQPPPSILNHNSISCSSHHEIKTENKLSQFQVDDPFCSAVAIVANQINDMNKFDDIDGTDVVMLVADIDEACKKRNLNGDSDEQRSTLGKCGGARNVPPNGLALENGNTLLNGLASKKYLNDYADKISAQVLKEFHISGEENGEYSYNGEDELQRECRREKNAEKMIELEDTYLTKLNGEIRDLHLLRDELRERRLMLANLNTLNTHTSDRYHTNNTLLLSNSYSSHHTHYYHAHAHATNTTIHEEDESPKGEYTEMNENNILETELLLPTESTPTHNSYNYDNYQSHVTAHAEQKSSECYKLTNNGKDVVEMAQKRMTKLASSSSSSSSSTSSSSKSSSKSSSTSSLSTSDNLKQPSQIALSSALSAETATSITTGATSSITEVTTNCTSSPKKRGDNTTNKSMLQSSGGVATPSAMPNISSTSHHQQHETVIGANTTTSADDGGIESWGHSNSTASLDSPSMGGGSTTHHRYYHVFREGELDALINHHVAGLHIVSSYYERASWCVVAEKVQVWTI